MAIVPLYFAGEALISYMSHEIAVSAISDTTNNIYNVMYRLNGYSNSYILKQLDEMDMTADGVPEAPFKKSENQAKIAIKIALNLARENGYDGVVMISGKAKNYGAKASGTNAKGNLGFYNNIAAKAMKNAAKNNGLDFSSTNIKDGKGNTWAKLPYINIKGTPTQPVDMYKNTGGYIHYPSFVDVVPTL